jgi:hypothetical protein
MDQLGLAFLAGIFGNGHLVHVLWQQNSEFADAAVHSKTVDIIKHHRTKVA